MKKKEEPKTVAAKKLPANMKRNLSRKKLDRFIKKISIPSDKELVNKYFIENPEKEGKYCIPRNSLIPKKDFSRLKKIGKDVASQKFGIKLLPLAAVVAFIILVFSVVITFRNIIVKKIIVNVMEQTFGAKTDIAYLNLYLTDGKKLGYENDTKWYIGITINGFEQGYIAEPMKNLFEISKSNISVGLTEAIRGKCDIKNFHILGLNFMTPRKTSAYLAKYANEENKFPLQLALEKKAAIAEAAAREELQKLFDQYNPDTLLKNFEQGLQTPDVAKSAYEMGDAMVKKWQTKPDEMAKQINDFSAKITDIVNADWSNLKDLNEVRSNIEKINSAIQEGKTIVQQTQVIVKDVQTDAVKVEESATALTNAIEADSKYVQKEIDKIKSFSIDDGIKILSGPIDTILYKTIGKYYPYMKKGYAIAMKAKNSPGSAAPVKQKKEVKEPKHKRKPGTMVYYKRDNVPKFIIERMEFTGGNEETVKWSGFAKNISNDMDKRGAPAYGEVKITAAGQNHKADVTVDARSYSKDPFISVNYTGDNYPIAVDTPQFKMDSASTISGRCYADEDGRFSISATLDLKSLKFETEKFEPAFAYDIYSRALSYLTELSIGIDFIFNTEQDFNLNLTTDADKQLALIIKSLVEDEIKIIRKECEKKLADLIDEMSKDSQIKLNEFIDIRNGINSESLKLDKINALLEEKKKELSAKLAEETKKSIDSSLGAGATDKIGSALQGLQGLQGLQKR